MDYPGWMYDEALVNTVKDLQRDSRGEDSILREAERLVHGPRQEAYGHPTEDFTRTGRMWGAILGIPDVPPEKVGLCMVALKLSREVNQHNDENLIDGAGYLETVRLVHEAKEEKMDR